MIDSVSVAAEAAAAEKQERKQQLQDSLELLQTEKMLLESQLTAGKGDLAAAYDKMDRIKEFQLMRAASTREEQIREQTILIDELEKQVRDLEKALDETGDHIDRIGRELQQYGE